jgi:hypothetical protein
MKTTTGRYDGNNGTKIKAIADSHAVARSWGKLAKLKA